MYTIENYRAEQKAQKIIDELGDSDLAAAMLSIHLMKDQRMAEVLALKSKFMHLLSELDEQVGEDYRRSWCKENVPDTPHQTFSEWTAACNSIGSFLVELKGKLIQEQTE